MVVQAAGLKNYKFKIEKSGVYEETLDIVGAEEDVELGSGAMGPHPLDRPWKIAETWVGIGFGLERLLMASHGNGSLGKLGHSLVSLGRQTADGYDGFDELASLVRAVISATGLPVMISPGVIPEYALENLKSAGATWYACYQETHNPVLFNKLRVNQS